MQSLPSEVKRNFGVFRPAGLPTRSYSLLETFQSPARMAATLLVQVAMGMNAFKRRNAIMKSLHTRLVAV